MSFLSFFLYMIPMEEGGVITQGWKSTQPFYLEGIGEKKRTCLLLIHGFTGNPGDFRRLGSCLHGAGYTVLAIRLPGHGTTPEEMRGTRWEDWWQHTLLCYDLLAKTVPDAEIIPIGYSMGGLLAMKLSLVRQTAGVVSLAAPIELMDRRIRYAGLVKYVKPYIHKQPAICDYLVIERGAYSKTPLACVESLYKHIQIMKRQLSYVTAPIFIGQGLRDATVKPISAAYIERHVSSRHKVVRYYPETTHAILADRSRDEVYADVLRFVEHLHTGKELDSTASVDDSGMVMADGVDAILKPTLV